MAAEKYRPTLSLFHQRDGPAQTLAVPCRAAGRGWPVGTLGAKWQIKTKHGETGGGERVGYSDQKLRLAVGPGSMREDDGLAAWLGRQMQEAAKGRFSSWIMKRCKQRLCNLGFVSTKPET